MIRYTRIVLAIPFYLSASLLLVIALKILPPNVREEAKKSFI